MRGEREALGRRCLTVKPLVVIADAVCLCRNLGRAHNAFEVCAVEPLVCNPPCRKKILQHWEHHYLGNDASLNQSKRHRHPGCRASGSLLQSSLDPTPTLSWPNTDWSTPYCRAHAPDEVVLPPGTWTDLVLANTEKEQEKKQEKQGSQGGGLTASVKRFAVVMSYAVLEAWMIMLFPIRGSLVKSSW